MVVIGKEMRAAVKYQQEKEDGIVSNYPWHYSDAEVLMAGDYDKWDRYDQYDEEAFGILPPIEYREGEAL